MCWGEGKCEGRCGEVWWEVWKSVLGCRESVGIGLGKCVEMWESVWDECSLICWGLGGNEKICGGSKEVWEEVWESWSRGLGSGELGSVELESGKLVSRGFVSGELGLRELGSGEMGSEELGSGELESGELAGPLRGGSMEYLWYRARNFCGVRNFENAARKKFRQKFERVTLDWFKADKFTYRYHLPEIPLTHS